MKKQTKSPNKSKPRAKAPKAKNSQLAPKSSKPKHKVIQELATVFEEDLKNSLPISIQPDGSIVYKKYLIKHTTQGNWGVYNIQSRDLVEQYYLKTSAIMAAKAYNTTNLTKFFKIKELDNKYWANYSDALVYKHNIKLAVDFGRFQVLLNKLEHSELLAEHYKSEISVMFKGSFV